MLKLAWRNIIKNPLSTGLSAILFAISIIIIILIGIVGTQLEEKFNASKKRIHMVVGAPGSELDLVLSSVFHISPPVENINIKDITFILGHPSVDVVPLAMGDHWAKGGATGENAHDVERRRIVGTDSSYLNLYNVSVQTGRLFKADMEVTIGYEVHQLGLNIGDQFAGVHGVVGGAGAHVHEDQLYTVVGIMEPSGTVLDQLILCTISSVWAVHDEEAHAGHNHGGQKANNKKPMEQQPEALVIENRHLSTEEISALKALINKKTANIRAIKDFDDFDVHSPLKNKDQLTNALLRTRSNLKSIIKASSSLAGHYYNTIDSTHTGATLSLKDSFALKTEANLNEIDIWLKRINSINEGDINPSEIIQYARHIEHLTYKIPNNFKRVWLDSIIQIRKAQMVKNGLGIQTHYLMKHMDKEITSLLVQFKESGDNKGIGGFALVGRIKEDYKGRLGVAMVDVQVQQLFELVEPGIAYLSLLAYFIMFISGISVLISLVKSLRERKYELALMRVMGATRLKVFMLVIIEGTILSLLGFILGFVLAHLLGEFMAGYLEDKYHYDFTGFVFLESEIYILLGTLLIGVIAALIPAILAMRTNISSTLSNQ